MVDLNLVDALLGPTPASEPDWWREHAWNEGTATVLLEYLARNNDSTIHEGWGIRYQEFVEVLTDHLQADDPGLIPPPAFVMNFLFRSPIGVDWEGFRSWGEYEECSDSVRLLLFLAQSFDPEVDAIKLIGQPLSEYRAKENTNYLLAMASEFTAEDLGAIFGEARCFCFMEECFGTGFTWLLLKNKSLVESFWFRDVLFDTDCPKCSVVTTVKKRFAHAFKNPYLPDFVLHPGLSLFKDDAAMLEEYRVAQRKIRDQIEVAQNEHKVSHWEQSLLVQFEVEASANYPLLFETVHCLYGNGGAGRKNGLVNLFSRFLASAPSHRSWGDGLPPGLEWLKGHATKEKQSLYGTAQAHNPVEMIDKEWVATVFEVALGEATVGGVLGFEVASCAFGFGFFVAELEQLRGELGVREGDIPYDWLKSLL